jgi:hypothetical protein
MDFSATIAEGLDVNDRGSDGVVIAVDDGDGVIIRRAGASPRQGCHANQKLTVAPRRSTVAEVARAHNCPTCRVAAAKLLSLSSPITARKKQGNQPV